MVELLVKDELEQSGRSLIELLLGFWLEGEKCQSGYRLPGEYELVFQPGISSMKTLVDTLLLNR
jgi:hypothetical protein